MISKVLCPLTGVITIVTLLIAPFITTHEPPSRSVVVERRALGGCGVKGVCIRF